MKRFGIDVSHHQAPFPQLHNPKKPGVLSWERIADSSSFAIVRGSYGTMKDRVTAEHVERARSAGLKVGLYHFYRPSQPVVDQLAVFRAQLDLAKIGAGDIVPTIDIEADPFPKPGVHVSPAWQGSVLQFIDAMVSELGDCMVYITQREFGMMGSPQWLLSRPLWVAHYTGAARPATPANKPWTIWQHRVGPYDPNGPGGYDKARPELDQNRLQGALPLIAAVGEPGRDTLPPESQTHGPHDDGLEDLLEQIHGSSWERIQDSLGGAGANVLADERRDTDPSDLAPESEPYAS
jgi:lysozyme